MRDNEPLPSFFLWEKQLMPHKDVSYFTCATCGKKFLDEIPDSIKNAVMFSLCLDCGKKNG